MEDLRHTETSQETDQAGSQCSCVICAGIRAHGLTECELIHYLAMKASWKLHSARLAVARSDADIELIKMELRTLEMVIRDRKALVDGQTPVQAEPIEEAMRR
jgi:hypothetical protein